MKYQKMHVAKWANEDKQQQKVHEEPSFKTSGKSARGPWSLVLKQAEGARGT